MPDDLARFQTHPPLPTEIVNYMPRTLSDAEIAALRPDLRSRYYARQDNKSDWTNYTSPDHAKLIDYSDPEVIKKYGPHLVPEDPSAPVMNVKAWKDPDDLRIYLRYQTRDGVWHPPLRSASDIDTMAHGPGSGGLDYAHSYETRDGTAHGPPVTSLGGERSVTYEQSETLQYKGAGGQLGEGDTVRWSQKLLTQKDPGSFVLENPANKKMLVKAIDTLTRGEKELVLRQDLNGYTLTTTKFTEPLANLHDAARAINALGDEESGGWSAETRGRLAEWGVNFDTPLEGATKTPSAAAASSPPSPVPKPPRRPGT